MRRDVFVGVGIDHYAAAELPDLDHAVADVEAVAKAIVPPFVGEPLTDADVGAVNDSLSAVEGSADGGTLVLMWSGHGTDLGGLRLATADQVDRVAAAEVIRSCVLSGASQLLLVIDTCQAGAALDSAAMARKLLEQVPPSDVRVWLGILVSCSAADIGARDGAFGRLLVKLLTKGPDSADQQRRWSKHNDRILGEDLGLALLEEWPGIDQRPEFLKNGHPLAIVPNPLYDEGAPEEVVEHLLRAARGGEPGDEQSWFSGRAGEVDTVVSWVRAGNAGVRVVVGSAGTGKSAVVGRVVSLSNPHERERLQRADEGWGHTDPGVRSVAAHVHARGLTVERIAEVIEQQLIRLHVLEPATGGRRNAAELLGAVQRVVEGGAAAPVVVIDGLDEARSQAFAIAEDLLFRLAPFATVVVSTRPLTDQDGSALLDKLSPVDVLDLDSTECLESAQGAISEYVRKRLTGVDSAMDASAVAAHLADEALDAADRPFLLARVITDQLRARPVNTVVPDWRDRIAHSIEDAFDADLARVEPPLGDLGEAAARERARTMLTALTWAVGAGFPEPEWLTVASALSGTDLGRDDVSWVVDQLGRYVVQDGDAGVAVYRLAHQSFADHLRPAYRPTGQLPFNPEALTVSAALLQRYSRLLTDGVPARTPVYLWRYAWVHAANAGFDGLDALRDVAHGHPELQADVAMAALQVANTAAAWGRRREAVAPTEEAVARYRLLAEENPAYLPDLAEAVNALSIRYSAVGRRADAVALVEEAVVLRRSQAEENPAYLPDLAGALSVLGVCYSEVGRRAEAVTPTEEAVAHCRVLAKNNPAYLSNLAGALTNLGNRYSDVGRPAEAVPATEEAVAHYRVLAEDNPAHLSNLATALTNLGNRYSDVGRPAEAVTPTEEAVAHCRVLVEENPAYLPDLAMTLNNLGNRYGDVGRRGEAVAPTKEAAAHYRVLAQENPAYLPDLAMALTNLGVRVGEVGRPADAAIPTEEAVALRRLQAEENPAYLPDLATALTNLGNWYGLLGRHGEAVALTEEGVALRRLQAQENPAYLPNFAGALNNLGISYGAVGRPAEAVAPTEEAIAHYRVLAEENPAYLPDLAMALNNLGVRLGAVGRLAEAVTSIEEAVALRRLQAQENPAYLPDLAAALNNLGISYGEVDRLAEAVTPTEEAVALRRLQAQENPAYLPDLAAALNNLGVRLGAVDRPAEAVTSIEEAIAHFRVLTEENPAYLPNLASALNNHGVRLGAVGRLAEAIAPTEEAIAHYQSLTKKNPAYLPNLASALNRLSDFLDGLNGRDAADAMWRDALTTASEQDWPSLLLYRAQYAEPGDPRTAAWLYTVARDGGRDLAAAAHSAARSHWTANRESWEQAWTDVDQSPLPPWLTVNPDTLAAATGWITTPSYEDECEYLNTHPEILDDTFDVAVDEALLEVPEDEAPRYNELRAAARSDGVIAAYRPLLLAILAQRFALAEPEQQRHLLTDHRADLLDDISLSHLNSLASEAEDDDRPGVALAILHLAREKPDDDLAEVFAALNNAGQFAALMHTAAGESDVTILQSLAVIALHAAQTNTEAADAGFHLAVAAVIQEDDDAPSALRQAINWAPENRNAWIARLAELGATHPAVLALIPPLTETAPDA